MARGRAPPPIPGVRQALGAVPAAAKIAARGVDGFERSLRSAVSWQMTGMARTDSAIDAPGLAARRIAGDILDGVLRRHRPLDEQLDDRAAQSDFAALAHRDRALVRALATVVLRRLGTLRHLLGHWLKLPADAPRVETALLLGAAQILWLEVPDHAAVDLAVRLVQADAARYAGLVNAVLRRGDRARDRRRQRAGTGARSDGEERSRALGTRARRARALNRLGARNCAWTDIAAAGL